MADLPPPPPPFLPLNRQIGDIFLEEYPYSRNLRDYVEDEIPAGKTREELQLLAARYSIYLANHPGNKLKFEQILNLNKYGQLGGAKRKSKKSSKKVFKKKSSKKTKSLLGGAKKRKSKKSSKKSSKKNSKKTPKK